jgi:hypothetical protein
MGASKALSLSAILPPTAFRVTVGFIEDADAYAAAVAAAAVVLE